MKVTITTTTINVPYLIEDYIKDVIKYNRQDYVDFIITGDKKTPVAAKEFCAKMEEKYNIPILFMDVNDQNEYMEKYQKLKGFLPWNCIQRRQVAILKAYDQGSDIIVLIDDDNYIACEDYVGKHLNLGKNVSMETVSSKTGWYNICEDLQDRQNRKFYPRGYSWVDRIDEVKDIRRETKNIRTVVNAGFWLGDPDIDAVTRLAAPIDVISYKKDYNYALEKETYSPFNSQNTAIHRDIVPIYFLVPDIGRFDDIWSSYIVERIAWQMNDYISYGQPLVKQIRNDHDYWVDAKIEEMGTKMTTKFCNWLRQVKLTKHTYLECGIELISGLKELIDNLDNDELPVSQRAYINHVIDGHKVWFETMENIKDKTALPV